MEWISVSEQALGEKLKSLAKCIGCSQNEALGILVRLWFWGINHVDQDGRAPAAGRHEVKKAVTIGLRKGLSAETVIDGLVQSGWLQINGGVLLPDWMKLQRPYYRALRIRNKDAERKREERLKSKQNSESDRMEDNHADPALLPPTKNPSKSSEADVSTDFELFWKEYPRKVGKGEAYKKYLARLNDGWKPSELLKAARNYAASVQSEHTETKYIKHPKTFLSSTTPFQDYLNNSGRSYGPIMVDDDDDPFAEWRRE